MLLKCSRSRGRPKNVFEKGPTPELIQKRQNHLWQWQVSSPHCFAQGWWHLFYHRSDITYQQFIFSQDFALLHHWSNKFNSQHCQWRSPIALPHKRLSITFSDTEQDLISGWWHELLKQTELTPFWKWINFLYDSSPIDPYQKIPYAQVLRYGRLCLIKLATHWVSRQDFLDLYADITRPSSVSNFEGQSNLYAHQDDDKQH